MAPINTSFLLTPLFDLPPLSAWLALPVGIVLLTTVLLWSGRIRQASLANGLCTGILLPTVNLTLVFVGLYALSGQLNQFWMNLIQNLPI